MSRRKNGEWLPAPKVIHRVGDPGPRVLDDNYRLCSLCGHLIPGVGDNRFYFCPSCGAKMTYPERVARLKEAGLIK